MKFLYEFKSFYKDDDIVLIEYWFHDIITPVKILGKINRTSYKVSHNVPNSKIFNAPDEIIKINDIIDISR